MNGWIVLDKPAGLTSTAAGNRVKRLLGIKKLGHAGTLDPFATGVLPLALGEATKTVPYLMNALKTYEFQITWGAETDTQDHTGQTTAACNERPCEAAIAKAIPHFVGTIEQQPPIYSALKINGERAYTMARKGHPIDLPRRKINITALEVISVPSADRACFRVTCSSGTYVRTLGQDLARFLGSMGHLSALRRTQVGNFTQGSIISLEKLEEIRHNFKEHSIFLPIRAVLDDIPAVPVSGENGQRIRQGQPIECPLRLPEDTLVTIIMDEIVLAVGIHRGGLIHPKRVFNIKS